MSPSIVSWTSWHTIPEQPLTDSGGSRERDFSSKGAQRSATDKQNVIDPSESPVRSGFTLKGGYILPYCNLSPPNVSGPVSWTWGNLKSHNSHICIIIITMDLGLGMSLTWTRCHGFRKVTSCTRGVKVDLDAVLLTRPSAGDSVRRSSTLVMT